MNTLPLELPPVEATYGWTLDDLARHRNTLANSIDCGKSCDGYPIASYLLAAWWAAGKQARRTQRELDHALSRLEDLEDKLRRLVAEISESRR